MKFICHLTLSVLLAVLIWGAAASQPPQSRIVAVKGSDIYRSTLRACDEIGLSRYIKPGSHVGILVNSDFKVKGAYVNPDVTLAVVKKAFDAGASRITFIQHIKPEYWERSPLYPEHAPMIAKTRTIEKNTFPAVFDEEFFVRPDSIFGARHLKGIEVVRAITQVDVFISIPIAKHHASTILTGAMKNLMGIGTRAFNVTFHLNGPSRNDPDFLATCIAELNLIRKTDRIVADATEVIVTNGPGGPGNMLSPMTVVASNDVVAIDAYCARLLGFDTDRVLTLKKGYELGLGQMDLGKVIIKEIDLGN